LRCAFFDLPARASRPSAQEQLVLFLESPDDFKFKLEFGLAAEGDMKTGILFFDLIWLCIGLVAALSSRLMKAAEIPHRHGTD